MAYDLSFIPPPEDQTQSQPTEPTTTGGYDLSFIPPPSEQKTQYDLSFIPPPESAGADKVQEIQDRMNAGMTLEEIKKQADIEERKPNHWWTKLLDKTIDKSGQAMSKMEEEIFKKGMLPSYVSMGEKGKADFGDIGGYLKKNGLWNTVVESHIRPLEVLGEAALKGLNDSYGINAPRERQTYADVIKMGAPEFAKEHPLLTEQLGMVGDISHDPLTYLSWDGTAGLKSIDVAGEKLAMSPLGEQLMKDSVRIISQDKALALATKVAKDAGDGIKLGEIADTTAKRAMTFMRHFILSEGDVTKASAMSKKEIGRVIPKALRIKFNQRTIQEILDKGGLKFINTTIPGTEKIIPAFKSLLDTIGHTQLAENIASTKGYMVAAGLGKWVKRGFSKNAGIQQLEGVDKITKNELVDLFNGIERSSDSLKYDVAAQSLQTFHDVIQEAGHPKVAEESINKIGEVWAKVQNSTRISEVKKYKLSLGSADPADKLLSWEIDQGSILKHFIDEIGLSAKEQGAVSSMYKMFGERNTIEFANGLMKQSLINDHPVVLKTIQDLDKLDRYRQWKAGQIPASAIPSMDIKLFDQLQQAELKGYKPEFNAMLLYSQRLLDSKLNVEREIAKEGAAAVLGLEKWSQVPKTLQNRMRFIESPNYSMLGNGWLRTAARVWDKLNTPWKKLATVANPYFGIKQISSNAFQEAAIQNLSKATGTMIPSAHEALVLMLHDSGTIRDSELLAKLALRPDLAASVGAKDLLFEGKDIFGIPYNGKQLLADSRKFGIMRDMNISTIDFERNLKDILQTELNILTRSPKEQAIKTLMGGALKYVNYPTHVENFFRMQGFISFIKQGYRPEEAAKLVEKAFFDYNHGLAAFERQVIRRIIPFYSYQRFVAPLIGNMLVHEPGKLQNTRRIVDTFLDSYGKLTGGKDLNPSERYITSKEADYLLEGNAQFMGYTPEMRYKFKTFRNLSFLDSFDALETNDYGDVDFNRTMRNATLLSTSPFIKVPIELVANHDYFKDEFIYGKEGGKRYKDVIQKGIEGTRPGRKYLGKDFQGDKILYNMAAYLAGAGMLPGVPEGAVSAIAARATTQGVGAAAKAILPDSSINWLKATIGYEEDTNPRTGEKTAFISPLAMYLASNTYPGFQRAVKLESSDWTPKDYLEEVFLGVGHTTKDLGAAKKRRVKALDAEKRSLINDLTKNRKYYGPSELTQKQHDLQRVLDMIAKDRAMLTTYPIKGGQYTPQTTKKY